MPDALACVLWDFGDTPLQLVRSYHLPQAVVTINPRSFSNNIVPRYRALLLDSIEENAHAWQERGGRAHWSRGRDGLRRALREEFADFAAACSDPSAP